MSVHVERRAFNTAEYHRMVEAGILSEDDRTELIEGEVIRMSPIGSRHAACVDNLGRILNRRVGDAAVVRVQNPVHLDDFSEPQPDVALLRPRADFYADSHPAPDDVLLVIEVADTSAGYDREVKVPLYARAGIPEVWVVDLTADRVEVYTRPEGGAYAHAARAGRGEELSPGQFPSLTLRADDVLLRT